MEQKSNKGLIVLIALLIILFLIVLALVGYIIWDKINNKTVNGEATTLITTTTNIKNDLSDVDKEWEEEKNTVYNDIINMLDEFIKKEFHQYDIKFNYNYMDDIVAKNNIVLSVMMDNDKIKKEIDVDVNN